VVDDVDSGKFVPAERPTRYAVIYDCRYQNNFREEGKLGDVLRSIWMTGYRAEDKG